MHYFKSNKGYYYKKYPKGNTQRISIEEFEEKNINQSAGNNSMSINTTAGNTTAGNTTAGNTTAGNMTAGNMTAGNMTAGNTTAGNMTAGNMTDGIDNKYIKAGVFCATVSILTIISASI